MGFFLFRTKDIWGVRNKSWFLCFLLIRTLEVRNRNLFLLCTSPFFEGHSLVVRDKSVAQLDFNLENSTVLIQEKQLAAESNEEHLGRSTLE